MPDRDNYVVPDYVDGESLIWNAAAAGDRIKFREGGIVIFRNVNATLTRTVTLPIWNQGRGDIDNNDYVLPAVSGFVAVGLKDTGTVDGFWIPVTYSAVADVTFALIQYIRQ